MKHGNLMVFGFQQFFKPSRAHAVPSPKWPAKLSNCALRVSQCWEAMITKSLDLRQIVKRSPGDIAFALTRSAKHWLQNQDRRNQVAVKTVGITESGQPISHQISTFRLKMNLAENSIQHPGVAPKVVG